MALRNRPESERTKPDLLNLCGKKSFWILAALLLYSVIAAVLLCISIYSTHPQPDLSASDPAWEAQYIWPTLLRLTLVFFALSFIPCVFYVIANIIRNAKAAHAFLVLGLIYHVLLFMVISLPNIVFLSNVIMLFVFLFPLCGYLILFYKATHGKK